MRVPFSRLNAIKREHSNPDDCLMHMLNFWLTNTTPSPTWETVVDALCCAAIGREQMADKIRRKYCSLDTGTYYICIYTNQCFIHVYTEGAYYGFPPGPDQWGHGSSCPSPQLEMLSVKLIQSHPQKQHSPAYSVLWISVMFEHCVFRECSTTEVVTTFCTGSFTVRGLELFP